MKFGNRNIKTLSIILAICVFSCKKNDTSKNVSLAGSWTFNHETSDPYNWSPTSDSIYVTFDKSNHYTYHQYNFPVDKGTFSIVQDSVLTIKPDSTYSPFFHLLHNLFYNAGPDSPLHYIGERISFQKNNPNELLINVSWTGLVINGVPQNNATAQNKFYFISRP